MKKIPINWPGFNWKGGQQVISDFIATLAQQVNDAVRRVFEAELNADVEAMLGREPYERAVKGSARLSAGQCPRCGGQRRADWVRNGYRMRHLLTVEWGELVRACAVDVAGVCQSTFSCGMPLNASLPMSGRPSASWRRMG